MSAAVNLVDVTKRFGSDKAAVDAITMSIEGGEYLSIIGPSGCGKTTALRIVSGFEEPTSGRVMIDGRDCTHVEPHKRNTAMVFQHFALFPHMTVAQNVAFGLEMRHLPDKERKARVGEMLRAVDIADLADRPVTQLSGGQQQRVGLARALVTRPDVLLLDEPLGSLDANLRERMIRVLKRLNRELGVAFMHVTHSQSEAFALSDRIVIMNRGRIEQAGTPAEIARHPNSVFVAQFVGKNNVIRGTISDVSDGIATVETPVGSLKAAFASSSAPAPNGNCHVVCPASKIALLRDDEAGDTVLQGRVLFSIREAAHVEVDVDLGHDLVLRVDAFGAYDEADRYAPGTPVRVGWQASDALILPV